jgi:RNA polymerase sigma-70 factor, ECF subfamily
VEFYGFDDEYLLRLRAGDFATEEHFVGYFTELIRLKLRARLRFSEAIEDVRQETFVRVFAGLHNDRGVREAGKLGAYVNSVCNNVLLEHYRASSREQSPEPGAELEIPDTAIDLVGAITQKETAEQVRAVLEELSEKDRRILKEIFLDERDKDDVCRDFGIERDYLRVLMHRAKLSFKLLYLKSIKPPSRAGVGG